MEEVLEIAKPSSKVKSSTLKNGDKKFQTYIHRHLQHISSELSLDSVLTSQLNSVMNHLGRCIASKANAASVGKSTILKSSVDNAIVRLVGKEGFAHFQSKKGNKTMELYEKFKKSGKKGEESSKSIAPHLKLIIPPARVNQFLRMYGKRISYQAVVLTAAFMDYVLNALISIGAEVNLERKAKRITPRDIYLGIYDESLGRIHSLALKEVIPHLKQMLCKTKIQLMSVGVNPSDIEELHVTKKKSKSTREDKSHRYRAGTVANREIKKFQKQSGFYLACPKLPLSRFLRKYLGTEHKISAEAKMALHFYIEDFVYKLFLRANQIARHSKKVSVKPKDIEFAIGTLTNKCS